MRDNIVTVYYKRSHKSTASESVWQWDSELWLRLVGFDLPPVYSVHFSNTPMDGEATEEMGDADGVPIPDYYLSTGLPVYAWLYLAGNRGGVTVYMITIPVSRRPKPTDKAIPEIKVNTIDRAIEALDGAVDEAEAAAERAEEAAAAVTGTVRYDAPQELTDEQKAQARENIGAGTGEGGGEYVIINDYDGSSINDAAPSRPVSIGVNLPYIEGVVHTNLEILLQNTGIAGGGWSATIDLTGAPQPFTEGWVALQTDGTVILVQPPQYEPFTLGKIEPLYTSDIALNEPFRVVCSADDGDYQVPNSDITDFSYALSAKSYVDNNAVMYSRAQTLKLAEKAQARANIGALSEDDLAPLRHHLHTYNSVRLFEDVQPQDTSGQYNTITFTWNGNTECRVSGYSQNIDVKSDAIGDVSPLPAGGIVPGQRYFAKFRSTGDKVRLWIRMITPGTNAYDDLLIDSDTVFTVPATKAGGRFIARLDVPASSTTYIEEEIVTVGIYTAPENMALSDKIDNNHTALLDKIDDNRSDVFDILTKYNSMKLGDDIRPSDSTRNGISYSWTGNSKCVVTGTLNSSNSYSNPYANVSPLPGQGLAAGGTYFIHHKSTAAKVWTRISWFVEVPGSFPRENHQDINADTFFTIPADAYNFGLDLYVPQNSGTVNETVEVGIYTAPSNLDLWNAIKALEARLNG